MDSHVNTEEEMYDALFKSEVMDRLKVMKLQEASSSYMCSDYLSTLSHESHHVDSWCRSQMVGWCFQIVDFIGFERETAVFAISYIDRFLSKCSPRSNRVVQDRREFQLAIMTALFMSIKLHERKVIDLCLMVEFSRGVYTKDDFRNMEIDILEGLNWRLNGPTPVSFLEHFVQMIPFVCYGICSDQILDVARYRIELSTNDYSIVSHPPSKVAMAALISSIRTSTATPELRSHRPKIMNILQEISGVDMNSASLRFIIQRTEQYEQKPFISSRRHSVSNCQTPLPEETRKTSGSHTCSPRGVSA